MLQFTSTMAKAQLKEELSSHISEKAQAYLVRKGFSEDFTKWLPKEFHIPRVRKIFEAKDLVLQLLQQDGYVYNQEHDCVYAANSNVPTNFFFGLDLEGNPAAKEVGVGHLVEILDDEDLDKTWSWYLGQYWLKQETYKEFIKKGLTAASPAKVPTKFITEYGRFGLTVDEAKNLLFTTSGEIWSDDDLGESEDSSRSIDAIKKKEFFDSLTEDEEILWKISRKYEKMLLNTNMITEFPRDLYSGEAIYSIDEIHKGSLSLNNVTYIKEGQEKKLGAFSRIWYFWEFFKNGQIDQGTLGYLAGVNDWVLNRFFEQNEE